MAEYRTVGIWLLLACSVGVFLLCFAFIDVRASNNSGKELQILLQNLSDSDTNSSSSQGSETEGTSPRGTTPHLHDEPVLESSTENTSNSADFGLNNGTLESHTRSAKVLPVGTPGITETTGRAAASNKSLSDCDFSQGRWVYDETYPLYRSKNCPFMDPGFRCVENGRPDTDFMKYRWQPHDCDLPRFDPKGMLERLRDQRLVFVGDSLGRNHWESMLCMLAEGVQNKSRIFEINGYPITKHMGSLVFRFQDYNCTVEYYREPFLVPQTRPPPDSPSNVKSVLKIDQVAWSVEKWWPGANILVFNTGNWWVPEKIEQWGIRFQVGNNLTTHGLEDAFQIAMKTWALWMEDSLDPATRLFFRSYAPKHFSGGSWNSGGHCNESVKPLTDLEMMETPWTNNHILDAINQNVKRKRGAVEFLDITTSTNYRSDGHPGAFSDLPPDRGQDCSHFCLPGVPDSWNEVLYATLLAKEKSTNS